MLLGAAVARTDAAAVGALLHRVRRALPERITALLEVESGLNDPMSIFLTVFLIHIISEPASATWSTAALLFAREMIGGVGSRPRRWLGTRRAVAPPVARARLLPWCSRLPSA